MSDDAHAAGAATRRLAALQATAAEAYAAITAADAALRSLAGRRVAAEQVLRQAVARRYAAARALAAHGQARPGWFRRLAGGFRADRDWAERLLALGTLEAETEPPLTAAATELDQVKDEFAAQVRARAEAVAVLRAATARCAAVQAELDGFADHQDTGHHGTG